MEKEIIEYVREYRHGQWDKVGVLVAQKKGEEVHF